jgi:dienelactone hydrolase
MAERLVIVSDMWGAKKGLWITSYLGYLQQYFDITFYDAQQLANIDLVVQTEEKVHEAFVSGGMSTAVAHLLKKEKQPCYFLGFSMGGSIIWEAAKQGLPIKHFYGVSPTRIRLKEDKPALDSFTLLYGGNDAFKPNEDWCRKVDVDIELVPNYGHTLYSDEKVIKKVCLELLETVTHVRAKVKKVV